MAGPGQAHALVRPGASSQTPEGPLDADPRRHQRQAKAQQPWHDSEVDDGGVELVLHVRGAAGVRTRLRWDRALGAPDRPPVWGDQTLAASRARPGVSLSVVPPGPPALGPWAPPRPTPVSIGAEAPVVVRGDP
jgi:hypothetical protein